MKIRTRGLHHKTMHNHSRSPKKTTLYLYTGIGECFLTYIRHHITIIFTFSTSTGTWVGVAGRLEATEMAGVASAERCWALEACFWASRLSWSWACCRINSCLINTRDVITGVTRSAEVREPLQGQTMRSKISLEYHATPPCRNHITPSYFWNAAQIEIRLGQTAWEQRPGERAAGNNFPIHWIMKYAFDKSQKAQRDEKHFFSSPDKHGKVIKCSFAIKSKSN